MSKRRSPLNISPLNRLSEQVARLFRLGRRALTRRGFWISITRLPGRSLLTVHGEVNSRTTPCFEDALHEAFDFSSRPVVVDLRDAEFADPGAVESLAAKWNAAMSRGMSVEIVVNATGSLVSAE